MNNRKTGIRFAELDLNLLPENYSRHMDSQVRRVQDGKA
jgi:hypothetical protein